MLPFLDLVAGRQEWKRRGGLAALVFLLAMGLLEMPSRTVAGGGVEGLEGRICYSFRLLTMMDRAEAVAIGPLLRLSLQAEGASGL